MEDRRNALKWNREPGHYEVYYLSATDRASGWGLWIRYTMVAPLAATGEPATASLWFMAMHPDGRRVGRKTSVPVERLVARDDPFELRIADALLDDQGMRGECGGARWDLHWQPRLPAAQHVHPLLERSGIAKTVLVLPHPDVEVSGDVAFDDVSLSLDRARGGQAHLWGSKHAQRWTWTHCNDFRGSDGSERPDTWFDGVSVFVPRLGREVGPSSPIVGRFAGADFSSTNPVRVVRNASRFGLTSWHLEAHDGPRRLLAEVTAPRETLVGVTYHDPDGDLAYCYNSETASMHLRVWDRRPGGRFQNAAEVVWELVDELVADGTAHFEYAQREPIADLELQVK